MHPTIWIGLIAVACAAIAWYVSGRCSRASSESRRQRALVLKSLTDASIYAAAPRVGKRAPISRDNCQGYDIDRCAEQCRDIDTCSVYQQQLNNGRPAA